MRLTGRVQSGKGDAARRLLALMDAYTFKIGVPIFPGTLNLKLEEPFDWFAPELLEDIVWFERIEHGGERDIVLLPCVLTNLQGNGAFLWSTTNAARDPALRRMIEIISPLDLRGTYGLVDGDAVEIEVYDRDSGGERA